jgi:hypothetical protein
MRRPHSSGRRCEWRGELVGKVLSLDNAADIGFGKPGIAANLLADRFQEHPTLKETVRIGRLGSGCGPREVGLDAARCIVSRGRESSAIGRGGQDVKNQCGRNEHLHHDVAERGHNKPSKNVDSCAK